MTNANLKQFLARIVNDSKLQDQLKGVTEKASFTETMVRLGNDSGFHFTAEDVHAFLIQNKQNPMAELSDADLGLVTGGRPPATSDGCKAAWTTLFGPCS